MAPLPLLQPSPVVPDPRRRDARVALPLPAPRLGIADRPAKGGDSQSRRTTGLLPRIASLATDARSAARSGTQSRAVAAPAGWPTGAAWHSPGGGEPAPSPGRRHRDREEDPVTDPSAGAPFPTTRWSRVAAARWPGDREALRVAIVATVADESEVEDELHALFAALGA